MGFYFQKLLFGFLHARNTKSEHDGIVIDEHSTFGFFVFLVGGCEPASVQILFVWFVVFSPDGKTLALATSNQIIKLWDVPTDKLIATLRGHQERSLLSGVQALQ